jgi:hypothetical protein
LGCSCIVEKEVVGGKRCTKRGAGTRCVIFSRVTGEVLKAELYRTPYVLVDWELSEVTSKLGPTACSVYDGAFAITCEYMSPVFIGCITKTTVFELTSIASVS